MSKLIDKIEKECTSQYRDDSTGQYIDQLEIEMFVRSIVRECAIAYHKTRAAKVPIEKHFLYHLGIEE